MRRHSRRIPPSTIAFSLGGRSSGDRDDEGEDEHDGGVAHREEEPDADRPPAALEHQPRRVVDRGDVVGVERVPDPEHVRQRARARERRRGREVVGVVEVQRPADDVHQRDDADDPRQPDSFGAGPPAAGRAGQDRHARSSSVSAAEPAEPAGTIVTASTGHTSTHSPQAVHRSARTDNVPPRGRMACTGHVSKQAPQPWQPTKTGTATGATNGTANSGATGVTTATGSPAA
jgi:hypothetical protein